MPGYPRPGQLANPNGFSISGPLALPGGVVYGQDAPIIREFLAAVSLNGGDCVILAPSLASLGYFVTRSTVVDSPLRVGIVTGARVGVSAASAASQPVWVVIDGPAWANAAVSTIAAGDFLGISSILGQIGRTSNTNTVVALPATVSFAASITSTGGGTYMFDVAITPAGLVSTDTPFAFVPTASLVTDLAIGAVWSLGSVSAGVRMIGVNVSAAIASQVSIPGDLMVARERQGTAGGVIGVALGSVSASGLALPMYVMRG